MMGLLNAQHRFAITSFAPLLFNMALIAVIAALLLLQKEPSSAAPIMAATVGAAGLLQLAALAIPSRRDNLIGRVQVSFTPEMRAFLRKAVPGMIANSGPQLLIVAGAIVASMSPSAVSWLYFANRLIELPLGMVGVAMGTVLVPEITRALNSDDKPALINAESRGLELAAGLALPAAIGLIVLREPIVHVLFEHGAFTAADTQATALALGCLALGLPAHVLIKTLSPAFFARGDTMTPLLAALKGIAVGIVLAVVLGQLYGIGGIAAAMAIGAWSNAVSLCRNTAATFGFSIDAEARRRLPRIVLATLLMGAALWFAVWMLPDAAGSRAVQIVLLGILIAAGIALYGLLLLLFRVIGWHDVRAAKEKARSPGLRE
jgi:putative peptidoglycan lipid II flippase